MLAPQPLDDRPPLLELSERRRMHPYHSVVGRYGLLHSVEYASATLFPHAALRLRRAAMPIAKSYMAMPVLYKPIPV